MVLADKEFGEYLSGYNYGAEKEKWLEYLRDVYRRVKGTPDAAKVAEYGKLEKAGKAFEKRHLLTELVETVISKHDDLYERLNDYLVKISPESKINEPDEEFWTMFDYFTGGVLFTDADGLLYYFKPDFDRFFQLVTDEYGVFEESEIDEIDTRENKTNYDAGDNTKAQ